MMNKDKKAKKEIQDVLMQEKADRRLLPHVPGKRRSGHSRRALPDEEVAKYGYLKFANGEDANARYLVDYDVTLHTGTTPLGKAYKGKAKDISVTGLGLTVRAKDARALVAAKKLHVAFEIKAGTMPEGLEMKVRTVATCVRPSLEELEAQLAEQGPDGEIFLGLQFDVNLLEYSRRHHSRYALPFVSFLLFVICLGVVLMRTESVVYFKFNKYLYLYSIIASTFLLVKYIFGALYRPVKIDANYTPGVTILVPCFNEETWIRRTILSAMDQFYPPDKLEVIVIDDCSTDHSVERIKETIEEIKEKEGPDTAKRIHYYVQPQNHGKRDALVVGAKQAKHGLVLFVDSDSFLNPYAIRNIVQPFKDEKCGGVSGRTDVANTYTNSLTKMQSVRYYIAFRIMKAAEGLFDAVTCLSGPLSCYRKDLVLKYADAWLNQRFLGHKATFGDDRAMTNFILRHHRTDYQDTAVCYTIVPNDYDVFLKQQMRWKRSWLRESLIASTFMWRKEPFMAVMFYMGVLVPIIAPAIVCYNLIYIPLIHRIFPFTFIFGMILMAGLMSACQLLLRRSSTWVYGIWFCLYYELVLLWQMPIAWFTFWKSTWGTRMTPADVAAKARKKQKHHGAWLQKLRARLGHAPTTPAEQPLADTTPPHNITTTNTICAMAIKTNNTAATKTHDTMTTETNGVGVRQRHARTNDTIPIATDTPQTHDSMATEINNAMAAETNGVGARQRHARPAADMQAQLAALQSLVEKQQQELAAQKAESRRQAEELAQQKIAAVRQQAEQAQRDAQAALRQAQMLKQQAELMEQLQQKEDDHASR